MDLVINLNKPKGITSHDATTKVKKIFKAKKAGHTGTLDPIAVGVLLICLNRATRLASYFASLDKEYKAVIKFGEATDTQDAQGNIIEKSDSVEVNGHAIKKTLKSFEGKILQRPPMFSALKHKGRPLYKYAKKGIDIPRKPRKIHIRHIELLNINLPYATFMTVCSKGTYIRTLCDSIGKKLGIGAHLFELERTGIGPFKLKNTLSIEELNSVNLNHLQDKGIYPIRKKASLALSNGVYTMDSALSWMPELTINESLVKNVKNGIPIKIVDCPEFSDDLKTASDIKIKSPDGEFLALGNFLAGKNVVKMDVVFG